MKHVDRGPAGGGGEGPVPTLPARSTPFGQATWALSTRWWWRLKRTPLSIVVALAQPALWLVLFGNLFAKSGMVQGSSYIAFMTAGVVIMTVFNGALAGGVEVLFDRETGMLKRLMAAPIPPAALLWSRFAFVLGVSTAQGVLILLVAFLLGVRVASGLGGVALVLATGVLLGIGVTALSMALAFAFRNHAQWFAVTGFVGLPILFASNALAPLQAMPVWLRWITRANPMTYAIAGARGLILDGFDVGRLLTMTAALVVFDTAMVAIALVAMRRAID